MGTMTFQDLGIAFAMNLGITVALLLLYSFFSVQPINARVYFTKWFILDEQKAAEERESDGGAKLQFSVKTYLHCLDWMFVALRKPEREMLAHAGLDMVVYLRMLKLGLKIFVPPMLVGAVVLFPTYYTGNYLQTTDLAQTTVDYITISNLTPGSSRYWAPWVCAWVFNVWALFLLREEYKSVAQMRLDYLADQHKAAQQFTVLVRQVPPDNVRTITEQTAQFFSVVHRDNYLLTTPVFDARKLQKLEGRKEWTENKITELEIKQEKKQSAGGKVALWRPEHRTGFMGLVGEKVESLEYYHSKLEDLQKEILKERERVTTDDDCVMPACFVSFRTRWGAAVAAQTQQCKDNTQWITVWAPDPSDVCWGNLAISYLTLTTRKYVAAGIVLVTILFYTVPIAWVQTLATLDNLAGLLPWLKPVLDLPFVNSFLTSFLPGLALMLFLAILPYAMKLLSSLEGYVSVSQIERAASGKMFYFIVFSVFFTNVLTGSVLTNLEQYIKKPEDLAVALGKAITSSSNFFITYTMINAWSAIAVEVVRIAPLIIFHIRNSLLVRTPQDRVVAMSAGGPDYVALLPRMELYFLLPFMFWILAPLYLPFVIVFFVFGFIVLRNQFLNVYVAQYDLGGGYWPHFHTRVVACMVLSQLVLICVLLLQDVIYQTIFLLPLPLVTFLFHKTFISGPYAPTFDRLALQEAMRKDTIDQVSNPGEDPKAFLTGQYQHPSLIAAFELMEQQKLGEKSPKEASRAAQAQAQALPRVATQDSEVSFVVDDSDGSLVPVRRRPKGRRTGSNSGEGEESSGLPDFGSEGFRTSSAMDDRSSP